MLTAEDSKTANYSAEVLAPRSATGPARSRDFGVGGRSALRPWGVGKSVLTAYTGASRRPVPATKAAQAALTAGDLAVPLLSCLPWRLNRMENTVSIPRSRTRGHVKPVFPFRQLSILWDVFR